MQWLPRIRLLLARRPWIHWLIVGILAAALGASVARSMASVEERRAAWGSTVTVFTASRAIAPGDPLADAVTAADLPQAMVPPSALRERPEPDSLATQHVASGEIIVAADASGPDGLLALLPETWMALAIEVGSPHSFAIGDHVAVLASGHVVAAEGIVVQTTADQLEVGVPATDAPAVADAATEHSAVVALIANSWQR